LPDEIYYPPKGKSAAISPGITLITGEKYYIRFLPTGSDSQF